MTDAARKTFEQKLRTAQMKEKLYGRNGTAVTRTSVTSKIKGLDTLLFFALAEFHDIKDINCLLGTMNSTVINDNVYGDTVAIGNLSWALDKAFGTIAEQGFERLGRWIDLYIDILDLLPKIHKQTRFIASKPVRSNSLMGELPVSLQILDKQLFDIEPNRFAKVANDTVRGDGNKIDRFFVTGFKGSTPVIKCLDYNVQESWKARLATIENHLKGFERLAKMPPPPKPAHSAPRRPRY